MNLELLCLCIWLKMQQKYWIFTTKQKNFGLNKGQKAYDGDKPCDLIIPN